MTGVSRFAAPVMPAGAWQPPQRPFHRQAGWWVLQRFPQRRWPRPSTPGGAADAADTDAADCCRQCARRSSGAHRGGLRRLLLRAPDEQGQTAIHRAPASPGKEPPPLLAAADDDSAVRCDRDHVKTGDLFLRYGRHGVPDPAVRVVDVRLPEQIGEALAPSSQVAIHGANSARPHPRIHLHGTAAQGKCVRATRSTTGQGAIARRGLAYCTNVGRSSRMDRDSSTFLAAASTRADSASGSCEISRLQCIPIAHHRANATGSTRRPCASTSGSMTYHHAGASR